MIGLTRKIVNLERQQKLNFTDDAEMMSDVRKCREAVGSLIYLTTCTGPDLSFVVSKLSQYFTEPMEEEWTTVKRVLRYLKGTTEKELCYRKCDVMRNGGYRRTVMQTGRQM